MPHWPKSKTNDRYRLALGDLVDSFPDDHSFHVEDVIPLLTTKRKLLNGKNVARLLLTEPYVKSLGHGRYQVIRNVKV